MIQPIRVQRTRSQKNISPNELQTVCVDRTTKWGNPFKLVGNQIFVKKGKIGKVTWNYLFDGDLNLLLTYYECALIGKAIDGLRGDLEAIKSIDNWYKNHFSKLDISELKGKNLACWCKLECKCHADILLREANK